MKIGYIRISTIDLNTARQEVFWNYLAKGLKSELSVESFDGIHACNIIGKRDRTKK